MRMYEVYFWNDKIEGMKFCADIEELYDFIRFVLFDFGCEVCVCEVSE